jgi:hypothetical protein
MERRPDRTSARRRAVSKGMATDPENRSESIAASDLRQAVGYRVDAPERYLGRVQGIPEGGRPARPLVLVVSDRKTVRFVSLLRVAAILPLERRIVLGPLRIAPARLGRAAPLPHPAPLQQAA